MEKKPNYWFKRRRYGWGWTPVTASGWLTVIIYLATIIGAARYVLPAKPAQPTSSESTTFFLVALIATLILIGISYVKGPTPRWRWGKSDHDNPDEDF